MTNQLKPYDYINSTNGNVIKFDNAIVNAQLGMEITNALLVAKRFSEDLLTRHNNGEITMTKNEFNDLLDNYEEILKVLYENDNAIT